MKNHEKSGTGAVIKGALAVLFAFAMLLFPKPSATEYAQSGYLDQTLLKTGATYAVIRGLNAAVSILKESEINIEPAGIGITLAAGQILDPLDDLTERISTLLVYSMFALGVQEMIWHTAASIGLAPVAVLLLLSLCGLAGAQRLRSLGNGLLKAALILLALYILMPATLYLNSLFYDRYLYPQIKLKETKLAGFIHPVNQTRAPVSGVKEEGLIEKVLDLIGMSRHTQRLKTSYAEFERSFNELKKNLSDIISLLLELGYLYLGSTLLQILFLPFLSVFALYRLYKFPLKYY